MPGPLVAPLIGAGASLLGGLIGGDAAGDAAQAQVRASREAQNFAYQQYLTSLGLQEPWRASGQSALNELNSLYGYQQQPYQNATQLAQQNHTAGQAANNRMGAKEIARMLKSGMSIEQVAKLGTYAPRFAGKGAKLLAKYGVDSSELAQLQAGPWGQQQAAPATQGAGQAGPTGLSVFQASPDYQFRRDEGMRDIGNSFAARGGAFSGNALRGLTDFNSGLASGEFGNYVNRRMAMAGMGQVSAGQQQQAGQSYGYQGINNIQNQGDARASGIANQGQMWGQGLMGASTAFGNYYRNRNQNQFNPYSAVAQNNGYIDRQFPSNGGIYDEHGRINI